MTETVVNITIKIPESHKSLVTVIKRALGLFKALVEKMERGEKV